MNKKILPQPVAESVISTQRLFPFIWHRLLAFVHYWKSDQSAYSGRYMNQESLQFGRGFRVGIGESDLTPPPGYPLGGFGPFGKRSIGVMMPLKAKVFFLQDNEGKQLVLCAADLWSVSETIGSKVMSLVHCRMKRESLLMGATHTHFSPSNFSSTPIYNQYGSVQPGFDQAMCDFLASRIASAIDQAAENLMPARLSIAEKSVYGLTINRSLTAFKENDQAEQRIQQHRDQYVRGGGRASLPEACFAVNPTLRALSFWSDEEHASLLGVASFFSVHNTVIDSNTPCYQSDLFGMTAYLVEQQLRRYYSNVMCGLFNVSVGDVSPYCYQRDQNNLERLATALSGHISDLLTKPPLYMGRPAIQSVFREVPFQNTRFNSSNERLRTSRVPLVGASQMGGALDGRTPLSRIWTEGVRLLVPHPEHGVKPNAINLFGWSLPNWVTSIMAYLQPEGPTHVPISIHRLGELELITYPGECTTTTHDEILASSRGRIVQAIGLGHEYLSYITTQPEYSQQRYEGASTLYGPHSKALLQFYITELRSQLGTNLRTNVREDYSYDVGLRCQAGQLYYQVSETEIEQALQPILSHPIEQYPSITFRQEWAEPLRALLPMADRLAYPTVMLESRDNTSEQWRPLRVDGHDQTSETPYMVRIVTSRESHGQSWKIIWLNMGALEQEKTIRFVVNDRAYEPVRCSSEGVVNL